MATSGFPEEDFACPVCLEELHDPATLPCGHSYCLPCIQRHWDQGEAKKEYSCPQCRKTFTPRPALGRSTVLVEAMEKLKVLGGASISSAPPSLPSSPSSPSPGQGEGLYPTLPVSPPRLCPEHRRPLELFCPEDRLFVCRVCGDQAHRDHRVVTAEEARVERQRDLAQMQEDTQRRIQERERNLQLQPQSAQAHKGAVQALQDEARQVFAELARSVEKAGAQVQDLLDAHEMAEGSRAEGRIHRLEQDLAQLRRHDEELRRLQHMQDHFCFLKNFLTLDTPIPEGGGEESWASGEAVVLGVQAALRELWDGHQELGNTSLARIFRTVNDASALAETPMTAAPPLPPPPEPRKDSNLQPPVNGMAAGGMASVNSDSSSSNQNPASGASNQNSAGKTARQNPPVLYQEPKTRDELLKFRFDPTLDPNTAYRHLRLSDGERRATLRADPEPYAEHAGRFLFWRQVLCREPLAGSPCYWEAEWTGAKFTVGVAYATMGRAGSDDSCRLGHNERSWGLYWSGTGFSLWHGGRETQLKGPKARRVGVYLDQQAGVLAFYRVSRNQAELLHRVQADFSGPLYPGFRFWTGVGSSVTLCQLD